MIKAKSVRERNAGSNTLKTKETTINEKSN